MSGIRARVVMYGVFSPQSWVAAVRPLDRVAASERAVWGYTYAGTGRRRGGGLHAQRTADGSFLAGRLGLWDSGSLLFFQS